MSSFTLEGADAFDGPPWKREESRSHETWMNTFKTSEKYFASGRISYFSEKKNMKIMPPDGNQKIGEEPFRPTTCRWCQLQENAWLAPIAPL